MCVVDLSTGRTTRRVRLEPGIGPDDGDHAGCPCWDGDHLLQPTRSALLALCWSSGDVVGRIDHPNFSDLHSVSPSIDGAFLVTSTGNELVLEVDREGSVLRRWERGRPVPPERDDRRLHHRAYKPHRSHPNHAMRVGDRLLVTELAARRCVDLLDPAFVLAFPEGAPHDGRLREQRLWFTTTNGWVIAVDPSTGRREVALDLRQLDLGEGLLGWCRGIEVDGEAAWVGLSQLRHAAWREAARFAIRGRAGIKPPARVVELDWRRGVVRAVHDLAVPGAEIYGITMGRADHAAPGTTPDGAREFR